MLILFFSSPGLIPSLIRKVTRSRYTHVAMYVAGALYEANQHGVVASRDTAAWTRMRDACAMAYVPAHPDDVAEIAAWWEHRVDRNHGSDSPLGLYSILGFIFAGIASLFPRFRLIVSLPDEYICSSAVTTALQCGGNLIDAEPRLETPASLARRLEPEPTPWTT